MYIKEPMKIENKSMDIIEESLKDVNFSADQLPLVKRMIHTTGDVDYRHIISFTDDFIEKAKEALKNGGTIYTDTNMVKAGINKKALEKLNLEVLTLVSDDEVVKKAKETGLTRSIIGLEMAVERGISIFVFGNAPTALFRLIELYDQGKVKPSFVVGVPVGFVGAAESKEALRNTDMSSVTTVGTKGGSNVAASIINALMYELVER